MLSLVKEVKPASAPPTSYSQSVHASIGDNLTVTLYLFNPRSDTIYAGGALYDQLPPGGGSVKARASLAFYGPQLLRDSAVTIQIPANAHLEYVRASLRSQREGVPETLYGDEEKNPTSPLFLPSGIFIGELVGGDSGSATSNRLWFSYTVGVVQDDPERPVWNAGSYVDERYWFVMADHTNLIGCGSSRGTGGGAGEADVGVHREWRYEMLTREPGRGSGG